PWRLDLKGCSAKTSRHAKPVGFPCRSGRFPRSAPGSRGPTGPESENAPGRDYEDTAVLLGNSTDRLARDEIPGRTPASAAAPSLHARVRSAHRTHLLPPRQGKGPVGRASVPAGLPL